MGDDHNSFETAAIVPDGKFWTPVQKNGTWRFSYGDDDYDYWSVSLSYSAVPEGRKVWAEDSPNWIVLYERNFITETSLSSTNVELPNQIRLFPNPTTSEVVLNSDKQYDIEVYDMLGNKVIELTGNTIDMSHLSSATYIVKAFDKIEQEHLSYKVIKK